MMRETRQAFGLFLAVLGVVAQLTLATAVPVSVLSLTEATVLCQHGGDTDPPASPAHHMPDCLLCFVCHDTSGPVGLLGNTLMPPVPADAWIARTVTWPPATAPPRHFATASRPRGPPILV